MCRGFIYSRQKSIIFRTDERTDGNMSFAAPTNVRSASRNKLNDFGGYFLRFLEYFLTKNHQKPQNSPPAGSLKSTKNIFVMFQNKLGGPTFFVWGGGRSEDFVVKQSEQQWCRMFRGYRNVSLLFTKCIYTPRNFHSRRNALLPFAKTVSKLQMRRYRINMFSQ